MATQAQIVGGEVGRVKGLKNESIVAKLMNGKKPERNHVPSVIPYAKYAVNKVDLIIDGLNCSLKTSHQSTQIQVAELDKFITKFQCPEDVASKLKKFFGSDFKKIKGKDTSDIFIDKCVNDWGVDVSRLCSDSEIRRNRLLAANIDGFSDVLCWMKDNLSDIVTFILSTGFCKNQENHAELLIWTLDKWDEINPMSNDAEVISIEEIVELSKGWDIEVKDSQSVLEFGAFTLQMKGSGSGAYYHAMQFNSSLKAIKSYLS